MCRPLFLYKDSNVKDDRLVSRIYISDDDGDVAAVPCDPSRWSGPQDVPYPRNVAGFHGLKADHSVTF